MSGDFHWLLPTASSVAARVDHLFLALLAVSGLIAFAIAALIVWFCIRYRKGANVDRADPPAGERGLEAAWTILPLVIFLGLFVWAAYDFSMLYRPPVDAMPVYVVAKQWMWKLQHANGRREIDELHVPLGRPVRLIMTSQDVIHSFYVPAFRIKQDVVPGRYTSIWFEATEAGDFHLYCAEYCGTDHAAMIGHVVVMPPAQFAQWLEHGERTPNLAARGAELFRRHGCSGCHDEHSSVHAPDLNGLLGRVVHLEGGASLIADENYIRDSMLQPKKDVVAGYEPIMPSFQGQLEEEDIAAIIAYLRSTEAMPIDEPPGRAPRPQ